MDEWPTRGVGCGRGVAKAKVRSEREMRKCVSLVSSCFLALVFVPPLRVGIIFLVSLFLSCMLAWQEVGWVGTMLRWRLD